MSQNDQGQVLPGTGMTITSDKSISDIDSANNGKIIAYVNKDNPPQEECSVQSPRHEDNEQQQQQQSDIVIGLDDDHGFHKERAFRSTVHCIVANNLFPRIKFLDKTRDLEFSMEEGTICHYLFNMCQLKYDVERMEYVWGKARKWVLSSITRLRSDKCTAIRNAFFGK